VWKDNEYEEVDYVIQSLMETSAIGGEGVALSNN
jgi:hypothetical protein